MMSHLKKSQPRLLVLCVALLGWVSAGAQTARAADVDNSSLKLMPADAAFYSTSLRMREQFDIIANSKAWAKLRSLPAVKLFWAKIQDDLTKKGGPLEQYQEFVKDPANAQLIELLTDMVSNEFFIYGGDTSGEAIELAVEMYVNAIGAAFMAGVQKQENTNELAAQAMLDTLSEKAEHIKAPDLIMGWKLSKTDRADAQLKRLETILKAEADKEPVMKGRVKTVKVGGSDVLTLALDGKMVPWNKLFEKYEKGGKDYDKLAKKLKDSTLSISLGVRDQYLVFAIGATPEHLAKLGKGKSLAGRAELKPLAKFADQRIIDVSYVSEAFMARIGTSSKDVDEMAKQGRDALKKVELPPELKKRLEKDLEEFVKDMKAYVTKPGAVMAFSFLTSSGIESYSYDWSEHPSSDGSKPLTLVHHLGGNPLLAAVGRTKYQPENYQRLVKWIKIANSYVDDFAVPLLNDDQKRMYEQFTKLAYPLLKRIDKATGDMLLPSLADGQSAFVLDAKWTSKQWFPELTTDKPMPMLELAIIMGVSDADLFKKACAEYRAVINDAFAVVSNAFGGLFPELKIPLPEAKKVKGGTVYYYEIPPFPGVDRRILPNIGLSDHVMVFSLSQEHSERVLAKTPLKSEALKAELDKPLTGIIYFDWAGTLDALTPWLEFAATRIAQEKLGGKDKKGIDEIVSQLREVLEILKVFHSVTCVIYVEDKATVMRSAAIFRDLK